MCGTLPVKFYQMSDLAGLLMQNPQAGPRFAEYPGLTSLWEQDQMQALVTDAVLTNALAAGATITEVLSTPSVRDPPEEPGIDEKHLEHH